MRTWDAASRRMQDPAPVVGEDDEDEGDAAGERGHRGEVHRDLRAEVILKEGAPALSGWRLPAGHQPRDRPVRDPEPELQQFPVDPRRAPEWVRDGHFPDQASNLGAGLGATAARSSAAGPGPGEAATTPRHDRGRTTAKGDFQSLYAARSPTQNSRSDQRIVGFGRQRR